LCGGITWDIHIVRYSGRTDDYFSEVCDNLVISDYMMPGISGLGLYFKMINDHSIGFKPFILISAFIEAIRMAPVQAVFGKPFDIELLVLEVKKFLP
jgi:CheY-like chemotaxis protein